MRKRRSINDGEAESDEINISPLIDMVFILLIFFIVTTVFVEETGVEVNKPQAASAADLEKNSILIAITDKNKIVYGGKEVGLSGVRSIVRLPEALTASVSRKDPVRLSSANLLSAPEV